MALIEAARSLSEAPTASDALAWMLRALARSTRADALAILAADGEGTLALAAAIGLSPAAQRVRFPLREHPRLARAAGATSPLRFEDPHEPDPYDGLLVARAGPVDPIHACLAVPIHLHRRLVGVLTLDALDPHGLDGVGDDEISVVAALAAAALPGADGLVPAPPSAALARLLGRSAAMARLRREIEVVARLPAPVLIQGETGTGKELVARALHDRSARAAGPLVVVNCAALPAQLVESELFGHAKGAFTGAAMARAGRFEAAHGGTLFLDEIGELPLPVQAALLRALQEGEIQRVGEDRPRRVDVRVLAATHRDLWRDAAEGRFRADLLHRLWVCPVVVPPLRAREGDVALLAEHFARAAGARLGLGAAALHPAVIEALERYPWPGNVRELDHAVQRALVRRLSTGEADPRRPVVARVEDLELGGIVPPPPGAPQGAAATLEETLDRARREAFESAFRAARGNAAEAARALGLSRSFAYKEGLRLGLIEGPRRGR